MIYEFRCECGCEKDVILSVSEYNQTQICECGRAMQRKISLPMPPIISLTSGDKVLKTLNKEDGFALPGGEKHRKRYEYHMAKGLNRVREVEEKVFTGFG